MTQPPTHQGPAYAPPAYGAPAPQSTNGLAIAAFVLAFFACVIGLILGYVARSQIKRTGEGGAGLALAAIIIGWVEIGLAALVVAGYLFFILFFIAAS